VPAKTITYTRAETIDLTLDELKDLARKLVEASLRDQNDTFQGWLQSSGIPDPIKHCQGLGLIKLETIASLFNYVLREPVSGSPLLLFDGREIVFMSIQFVQACRDVYAELNPLGFIKPHQLLQVVDYE
jgi:hypothetical protein